MPTRSTLKVRRDWAGGKRGEGLRLQREGRRVRRPDPRRVGYGPADDSVTACGGLAAFGSFLRELGIDRELRRRFHRLKTGEQVVYPMQTQLRLLMDAFAVGEQRPFGLEALSADPLFVHLAGGFVPSLDTVYRDLCRFDDVAVAQLEEMVAAHGLFPLEKLRRARHAIVHLDIDTTVTPLFGDHEGALPGPNPRYHGRPSYHPMLARVAESDTVVGAMLRPGDCSFGADDVPAVGAWIDRTREAIGRNALLRVRIDAAGDCTDFMQAVAQRGAHFFIKAHRTRDLLEAVWSTNRWNTVEHDVDGKPSVQVAEIDFARKVWRDAGLAVRVVAVRSKERDIGQQLYLWELDDYSVQVFLTNDVDSDIDELARCYNGRAGIEPLIAELKGAWGIGEVPSSTFVANHAALLLKMLVHNLLKRFISARVPALRSWRTPWVRRVLLRVPARLVRHGRSRSLRFATNCPLHHLHQLE